jgi:hypothetical protein
MASHYAQGEDQQKQYFLVEACAHDVLILHKRLNTRSSTDSRNRVRKKMSLYEHAKAIAVMLAVFAAMCYAAEFVLGH